VTCDALVLLLSLGRNADVTPDQARSREPTPRVAHTHRGGGPARDCRARFVHHIRVAETATPSSFLQTSPLSPGELYQLTLYKWRYSLEAYGFDQDQVRELMFLKWLHASRRGRALATERLCSISRRACPGEPTRLRCFGRERRGRRTSGVPCPYGRGPAMLRSCATRSLLPSPTLTIRAVARATAVQPAVGDIWCSNASTARVNSGRWQALSSATCG